MLELFNIFLINLRFSHRKILLRGAASSSGSVIHTYMYTGLDFGPGKL